MSQLRIRKVRKLLELAACAIIPLAVFANRSSAQTSPHLVQFDNWVREYLTAEWDAHAADSVKYERGYCLTFQRDYVWDEIGFRVTKVERAKVVDSTSYSLTLDCPKGTAIMHVHPAQTIYVDGTREELGPDSYQCFPSGQDVRSLTASGDVFAVVQCDRRALIVYWPVPSSPAMPADSAAGRMRTRKKPQVSFAPSVADG